MADGTSRAETGSRKEPPKPWQGSDGNDLNYYQLLQVDPRADIDVIKAARNKLQMKYHPDKNKGPDATEMAKRLNAAFEKLENPTERATYDAELAAQERARQQAQQAEQEAKAAAKARAEQARADQRAKDEAAAKKAKEDLGNASAKSGAGAGSTSNTAGGAEQATQSTGTRQSTGQEQSAQSSKGAFLDLDIDSLTIGSPDRLKHAAGNAVEIAKFNNWWEFVKWLARGKKFPKPPEHSGNGVDNAGKPGAPQIESGDSTTEKTAQLPPNSRNRGVQRRGQ